MKRYLKVKEVQFLMRRLNRKNIIDQSPFRIKSKNERTMKFCIKLTSLSQNKGIRKINKWNIVGKKLKILQIQMFHRKDE